MSTQVGIMISSEALSTPANRGVDRWIYPAMALLFLLTVLLGFIPSSLEKVAARVKLMPLASRSTVARLSAGRTAPGWRDP